MLDHMVQSMFSFQEIAKLSSKVGVPVLHYCQQCMSPYCSTSSSEFAVVSVLDFEHSNRCVVVSHYCVCLHFPDDI